MKRLFLLRHAKAAPAEPGEEDHDRVLLPRGQADARAMGAYLAKRHYRPVQALVSAAARTAGTADLALAGLETNIILVDALYLAPAIRILGLIHAVPAAAPDVMIIGHNPGLEECATLLAREVPRHGAWEEKFPTCALVVLDFKIQHWRDLAPGEGALADYVRPKDF